MELFGPIFNSVAGFVHANELRSLAFASRSCFASAQVALQNRPRWVREDYHGFNFRSIGAALDRVRRLEEFQIDADALIPSIHHDIHDDEHMADLGTRVQRARTLIANVVRRNLGQLTNVQVFNDIFFYFSGDFPGDVWIDARFFFAELRPSAGQLISFSTHCDLFSECFEDFLRAAHRLSMLNVPNLTLCDLFSTPRRQCPRLMSMRMLRVSWSDEEGIENPFDSVLDRFPHLQRIVLTDVPFEYATTLARCAVDRSLNLEVE